VAWIDQTLARLGLRQDGHAVEESTALLGQGIGLDSMEILQLVAAIEERFDVTIDEGRLGPEPFRTVGTLVDFIGDLAA
jgi:acyl carrier protein